MRDLSIVLLICGLAASAHAQLPAASDLDVEGLGEDQADAPSHAPAFGDALCDLLEHPEAPIGPIRETSPQVGAGSPSTGVALRDLVATPARVRLPVELGTGLNSWARRVRLTVTDDWPLAFVADRSIRLWLTDEYGAHVEIENIDASDPDDRMCSQVRFVALAHLAPGAYFVTVEADTPGTVGLVATHLPTPPPPPPAPPQRTPGLDDSTPGAVDERIAQWAEGAVEWMPAHRTPPEPTERSDRPGDPPSGGNRSTVIIPCAYDVRFVSFTPRSAPGSDQRGEFAFEFTVEGNAPVAINDFGNAVGVDQTRFLHQPLGKVLIPCDDGATIPVRLTGREADDWWIFGFVNPDEKADQTEAMAVSCGGAQTEFVQTYTMEFRGATGVVRHTVDVELAFRQQNQAESCDEYDEVDDLSPCTYDVELVELEHVSSPGSDKNGRFQVGGRLPEGFGQKYPVFESTWIEVKRPDTEALDLKLATYTVPCGETFTIPLRVSAKEDDVVGDDFGALTQDIELTCPPGPMGHAAVTYPIDLAQQNGTVKHHIRVAARGRLTAQDFCAPQPVVAACVFGVDGYDITHTVAPNADKKGEFSIGSELGYGDDVQWNAYDVELGETSTSAWDQGTVEVPCTETVEVPLQIHARENDIINLFVNDWEIMMQHEYGGATVPLQFTCPPIVPSTAHSTHIELRNGRGNRQHEIDLSFTTRFDNPATACFPLQVPAPEPPAAFCELEIDLWKFAHEDGSTGDRNGKFEFEFEVNYPGTAHPTGAGQDQGPHWVYRGNEKTIAEPIVFPDLGEPGTSWGPYFQVPVNTTVPVSIRVDVTEKDPIGNDKGWRETTLNLHCGMTSGPQDVVLPIKINDDKHLGVITLRIQEY